MSLVMNVDIIKYRKMAHQNGFISAMALAQPWLWLSYGFESAMYLAHLWLWVTHSFGSAMALAQIWI